MSSPDDMFDEEDEEKQDQQIPSNVVHMVWEDEFSQPSTQASSGLHFSTPVDHAHLAGSENIDEDNHLSFEELLSKPVQDRKLKYSRGDVKVMLTDLKDVTEVASMIVDNLIGGNHLFLNKTEDIDEVENLVGKVKAKLYKLKGNLQKRQFRKHPELLEVTFLTAEEYNLHHSFEFINDDDKSAEPDVAENPIEVKTARKPLNEITNRKYQRERTAKDYDTFKEMADNQEIEVGQMAGYFMQREYYHTNRYLFVCVQKLYALIAPFY